MGTRHCELEDLVINRSFWVGKRVFLTGHTGFKGAWLCLLLSQLGAEVYGLALEPESEDGLFVSAAVKDIVHHTIGDIREVDAVGKAVDAAQPDIVIHMAAQPLVRRSYQAPVETYATNVMGTVHLLECVRSVPTVQAVVIVTSDKCYENREWPWSYREADQLGGRDPYSNSKGCAEMVTAAYRDSFFQTKTAARVATVRAGNVIGGGDWSTDRLVPDAMRAFISKQPLRIRNPSSVRPWQHVLDPLIGYLVLTERLVNEGKRFEGGWNFGPQMDGEVSVAVLADALVRHWGEGCSWEREHGEQPHEANYLKLDCSKARNLLGWRPLIEFEDVLRLTVDWYRAHQRGEDMRRFSLEQSALMITVPRMSS
ncbi:CDP-glucose 4,6-dehydratase [Bradyrhizobium sp. B117]|uniref:CDP-glucose 4,6-dehydratase n=1 Tax=Bradyrhizobium sp. B117 TaxID=3140246 RepID=UPI0031832E5F